MMEDKGIVEESTLESEIDALSKMITDTKDVPSRLVGSDQDFKLDSYDFSDTGLQDDELGIKDILDSSGEMDSFMSATDNSLRDAPGEVSNVNETELQTGEMNETKVQQLETDAKTVELDDTLSENSQGEPAINEETLNANNSLSLISDAYTSQESQSCLDRPSATVVENIQSESQKKNKEVKVAEVLENTESISVSIENPSESGVQLNIEDESVHEIQRNDAGRLTPVIGTENSENTNQRSKDTNISSVCSEASVPNLNPKKTDETTEKNCNSEVEKLHNLQSQKDLEDEVESKAIDDDTAKNLKSELESETSVVEHTKLSENVNANPIVDSKEKNSMTRVTENVRTSEDAKDLEECGSPKKIDSQDNQRVENSQSSLACTHSEPHERNIDSDNTEILQEEANSPEQLFGSEKETEKEHNIKESNIDTKESSQLLKETKDSVVESVNNDKSTNESVTETKGDLITAVEQFTESREKPMSESTSVFTIDSGNSGDVNIEPFAESIVEKELIVDTQNSTAKCIDKENAQESSNIEPLKVSEYVINTVDGVSDDNFPDSKSPSVATDFELAFDQEEEEGEEAENGENLKESTDGIQNNQSQNICEKKENSENELESIENLEIHSENIPGSESSQVSELVSEIPEGIDETYEETIEYDRNDTVSEGINKRKQENEVLLDDTVESKLEQARKIETSSLEAYSSETEINAQEILDTEKNEDESETDIMYEDFQTDENLDQMEDFSQLIEPEIITNMNYQRNAEKEGDSVSDSVIDEKSSEISFEKESEIRDSTLESEENFEETEALENDGGENQETVETMIETSESETAVKFLQESEENIENTKMEQKTTGEGNSSEFISVDDNTLCDNASDLASEINLDPIAISEAEIISEAAKLESEKKKRLELQQQQLKNTEVEESMQASDFGVSDNLINAKDLNQPSNTKVDTEAKENLQIPLMPEIKLTSKPLPRSSVLEDRYKEPPRIDIPETSSQIIDLPSDALKTSVPVAKEASYERFESPEKQITNEAKISDTPRKDHTEKHQQPSHSQSQQHQQYSECENVGSPRIILKIAKSAIADCSEPRSPKSPKIRSAANSPNPEDSPSHKLGKIKLKLSKGGHPSIISSSDSGYDETVQWHTESNSMLSAHGGMKLKLAKTSEADRDEDEAKDKDKLGVHKQKHKDAKETTALEALIPKKQDSLGMKIKLSKSGDASIIQDSNKSLSEDLKDAKVKAVEDIQEITKRTESPLGMKIKLSKSGDASIISSESDRAEPDEAVKTKIPKDADAALVLEASEETLKLKSMKLKLGKSVDASVTHVKKDDEGAKKAAEQPLGMMKIKLSKTGEPSIIQPEGVKHAKNKDYSIALQQKPKDDSHLEMKIKLSKTGHPTIIANNETLDETSKIASTIAQSLKHKDHKDLLMFKESTLKELKRSHSDVTIEPVTRPLFDNTLGDVHNKRKEISIAPVESKKAKMEANLKQMFPDITIQPVSAAKREQQKLLLDPKTGNISRQQMKVINQEISITQVCSLSSTDPRVNDQIKNLQEAAMTSSKSNSDCEIIDPQPELIIVNENSNSSQDIMIIDEVPSMKSAIKVPKKRGRPRRNAVGPIGTIPVMTSSFQQFEFPRDPLSLDQSPSMMMLKQHLPMQLQQMHQQIHQPLHMQPQMVPGGHAGTEAGRPRRTCRSQKSYAPPKRGRGRGRGKRKNESMDIPMKKVRIEHDLTELERSTTALIALEKLPIEVSSKSPELFKALSQPTLSHVDVTPREVQILKVRPTVQSLSDCEVIELSPKKEAYQPKTLNDTIMGASMQVKYAESTSNMETTNERMAVITQISNAAVAGSSNIVIKVTSEVDKPPEISGIVKDPMATQEHQLWLAPSIKKVSSDSSSSAVGAVAMKSEAISTLTVMDEETRMSAESCSRSQTPARGVPIPGGPEVLAANEESQGSVLSTATTESEKVKVKIRRMEINFDPDEGPFTVEKIAEYEWPLERKEDRSLVRGETFMIQEQISQYLGVKSFKRKYPDLKRRMVDMEERNFLRENGLVSESMCDMGLTAVSSSEVLDIMCSDFPEQYEEYRKHMREKAAKEHSKKQKELSAAANAERSRIDLAEMAMQSALTWNAGLNKARRDDRKCSLDLQTYTVHVPLKRSSQRKLDPNRRNSNNYPVALMPGQYAEFYRDYTPAELRYYPLNTVLYGPMRPNERKFDSQSEGSQSDSDSDSSSDDSSSSSSEGTQDTEGSQSAMDEVDMELAIQSDVKCKICSNSLNKNNRPEVLIQCGTCSGNVHPSCMDLTLDMVPHIRAYAWQCTDCKTCAQCHDPADEDKMLFCDMCDRGYHIYCVGLRRVPQGRWHCQECAVCANCGSKEPGGANSDRNSVAQWQHEFKKADKNTRVYVSTFCVPCSKLWRKGRYCPHCSRCHNAPRLDLEPNLVHCGACDKYLHLDCVETKGMNMSIDKKNYLCEFCCPNRQPIMKPLTSKIFKT
ncbi:abnormal long morphology protein 1 [Copidosoma floridanum]|uniref:abnormal long morphology protein 1 n=1 Tax=Copidosoma floridanum TaxID=29053 RepID=UPI0006C9AF16|nr:abnormal long morphology protein 1 [Copidosoma floridanum]